MDMLRAAIVLLAALGLGVGVGSAAEERTFGPYCFVVSAPLGGTFELFFTPVTQQHLSLVGHVLSNGRPVNGTLVILSDTTARLALIEAMSLDGSPTVALAADLNLLTGSGPGRCERLAGADLACGQGGQAVTVTLATCP